MASYGLVTPESAADFILVALAAARAQDLRTLLFAFGELTLTRPMTIVEAHHLAERLARSGRGLKRAAFVVTESFSAAIQHIVTAAANRGLAVGAFANEVEALAWLDAAD